MVVFWSLGEDISMGIWTRSCDWEGRAWDMAVVFLVAPNFCSVMEDEVVHIERTPWTLSRKKKKDFVVCFVLVGVLVYVDCLRMACVSNGRWCQISTVNCIYMVLLLSGVVLIVHLFLYNFCALSSEFACNFVQREQFGVCLTGFGNGREEQFQILSSARMEIEDFSGFICEWEKRRNKETKSDHQY